MGTLGTLWAPEQNNRVLAGGLQVHIIEPGVFKTTNLYKTFISDMDKMWAALPNDVQRDYGEDFYKTSRFKLENYVSQQVIS